MLTQKWYWVLSAVVVLSLGSFLLFRPKVPLEVVKIYSTVEPAPPPASKKQSAPLQSAQSPGSPCCPPANVSELTSAEAIEGATPLAVETSDVDTTQSDSAPLSEDKVVPDAVVQEAERFREWEEKSEALQVKWKEHNRSGDQHLRDSKHQLVKMLMTLPIETRRNITEKMKTQMMRSLPPEVWDQYEADLYSIGLDFTTKVSPEESATLFQQMIPEIIDGAQTRKEHSEETQKLLQEHRAVDSLAGDF